MSRCACWQYSAVTCSLRLLEQVLLEHGHSGDHHRLATGRQSMKRDVAADHLCDPRNADVRMIDTTGYSSVSSLFSIGCRSSSGASNVVTDKVNLLTILICYNWTLRCL